MAFDLGCLERELFDFLLAHHVTDEAKVQESNDATMDKSVAKINDPDVDKADKKRYEVKLS